MKAKWVPVVVADKCNVLVAADASRYVWSSAWKSRGIAVLPRLNACGSEEHCITECRDHAIHMAWVPMEGNETIGI